MWQAEVLCRQGSWCKRFDDEDDARRWIRGRIKVSKKTVNPVQDASLHLLDMRDSLPYPERPFFNADELLKDEGFWNK